MRLVLTPRFRRWQRWQIAILALAGGWPMLAIAGSERTDPIVISKVFHGYARAKLADGTFKPETYAFGDGGLYDGQPSAADSIYRLRSPALFNVLAKSLARQNYVASSQPETTKLLIMVFLGTTRNTTDPQAPASALVEQQNARILGFYRQVAKAKEIYFTTFAKDVFDELRVERYFVVLQAYDYQVLRQAKHLELLWESRFSIRRQGSDFAAELPAMAEIASSSFGRQNSGVLRPRLREGRVEIGPTRVVASPAAEDTATPVVSSAESK